MITVALNEWTDSKGQVRRYVNNWRYLLGIEIAYHDTGSVKDVLVDGAHVSNSDGQRILATKVWLDSDDQVHVDRYDVVNVPLTAEDIKTRIAAIYAESKAGV